MRRDFTQVIYNLKDEPMKDQDGTTNATLCSVAINALLGVYDDEKITGKMKADRMQLALKINKKPKEVDLTAEQMTMLKELIGKAFAPMVVGRAYDLLEQEPKAVEAAPPTA